MEDSDAIVAKSPDNLMTPVVDGAARAHWKICIFLFLAFLLVNSRVFIDRILVNFAGAVDHTTPTSWGTALQALFLVLIYMIVDVCDATRLI